MVCWFGRRLVWTLALVLMTSLGAPTRASAQASEAAAYRLGTGDKVRVTVYNEPSLSGDFDVNDQGLVALGLMETRAK